MATEIGMNWNNSETLAHAPLVRCAWAKKADPLMQRYHDHEWGLANGDRIHLIEHLALEGFQAGLSWAIVLNKRQALRNAFHAFQPERVCRMDGQDVRRLLGNTAIIRNRLKIEAVIANAQALLDFEKKHGSFAEFLWQFKPMRREARYTHETLPAHTEESHAMSKTLKSLGFRFVGPTGCYAFMQSVGIVNDHTVDCFRWSEGG